MEKKHRPTTDWRFPHPVPGFQVWSICLLEYRNSNIDSALVMCWPQIKRSVFGTAPPRCAFLKNGQRLSKEMCPKKHAYIHLRLIIIIHDYTQLFV